jgi:hypothetical protein
MSDNVLDRERLLREEIARDLPEFARACAASEDFILMSRDAFAPLLGSNEILLLGKAIKYAGLVGKEVRIIPSARRPS